MLTLLPLLSLALAILACGISVGSHYGYQPPPVTHLPATQLRLEIQVSGQYETYGGSPNALIQIHVYEQSSGKVVSLPAGSLLTCNGVEIRPMATASDYSCRRQPPGGAYRLAYTDEHGAKTTVVVPVPTGSFAILAPQDGAHVPIPTHGTFIVHYTAPDPPAGGSITLDSITVACSVSDAQPCGAFSAKLSPSADVAPGQGSGVALVAPLTAGIANTTPAPGKTPTGGPTPTGGGAPPLNPTPPKGAAATPPSTTATVNVANGTILLTGDYSTFQPARGFVSLAVGAHVIPDPGAFVAVTADYTDTLQTAFTWTR